MEFVEKWNNGNMHERVKKIAVVNLEHEQHHNSVSVRKLPLQICSIVLLC